MNSAVNRFVCACAVSLGVAALAAQQHPSAPASNDPRVGLKPGLKDAAVAALNMELVTNLPKPPGFFDPKAPAGTETEPETPESNAEKPAEKPGEQPSGRGRGRLAGAPPPGG